MRNTVFAGLDSPICGNLQCKVVVHIAYWDDLGKIYRKPIGVFPIVCGSVPATFPIATTTQNKVFRKVKSESKIKRSLT